LYLLLLLLGLLQTVGRQVEEFALRVPHRRLRGLLRLLRRGRSGATGTGRVLVEAIEESHAALLLQSGLLGGSASEWRRVLGRLLSAKVHAREQSAGALSLRGRVGRLHKAECVLLLRLLWLLLAAHLVVVHEGEGVLLLLLGLTAVVDVHASEEVSLLLLRRLL
jgi:hypothetical protein